MQCRMSPKRCNTSLSRVSTTSLGAATSNYIQSRKDIEFFPSSLSIFTPTTLDLNPGTQEPSCFIKRVQLSLCRRSSPKSRLAWASAHDVSSCGRSLCGDGCLCTHCCAFLAASCTQEASRQCVDLCVGLLSPLASLWRL